MSDSDRSFSEFKWGNFIPCRFFPFVYRRQDNVASAAFSADRCLQWATTKVTTKNSNQSDGTVCVAVNTIQPNQYKGSRTITFYSSWSCMTIFRVRIVRMIGSINLYIHRHTNAMYVWRKKTHKNPSHWLFNYVCRRTVLSFIRFFPRRCRLSWSVSICMRMVRFVWPRHHSLHSMRRHLIGFFLHPSRLLLSELIRRAHEKGYNH